MAVPEAPMPVHTAYAGPTSSFFRDRVSRPKLPSAKQQNAIVGHRRVKPWESLRHTAKPVSSIPATMTSSHAMCCPSVCPARCDYALTEVTDRQTTRWSVAFLAFTRGQQPAQRVEAGRVRVALGDPLVQRALRLVVAARARAVRRTGFEVREGVDDAGRVDVGEAEGPQARGVDHPGV